VEDCRLHISTIEETARRVATRAYSSWQAGMQILLLAVLVAVSCHRVFITWAQQLWTDPYYSHCFFIPLFSGYILWSRKEKPRVCPLSPNWAGLLLTLPAVFLLILGVLGDEYFLARISLLLLLAGILVQFCGWRFFRAMLFPWAVLFLMIPLPRILFAQITLPLQFLSSGLGSSLLDLAGVANVREGNLIHLHSLTLDVAEACSGLRSIMSLITIAVIYGYLFDFRKFQRLLLVLFAVPVAVAVNALRIMGTGLLGLYLGADKSEGFLHSFSGIVTFVFSFCLLVLFGQTVRWALRSLQSKATT